MHYPEAEKPEANGGHYDQTGHLVRYESCGVTPENLEKADIAIIVDVLSFSTCVDIGVSRGAKIYPYPWKGEAAAGYAASVGAVLAGKRDDACAMAMPARYNLSPASLLDIPSEYRLVLPSPNGSTLAFQARDKGCLVVAGCLRNARAIGRWASLAGRTIMVLAAGERREDFSLRYAHEDVYGAGAILRCMEKEMGRVVDLSPAAKSAVTTFEEAKPHLYARLIESESGKELLERGFPQDIELAAQLDVSNCVPILRNGCFEAHILSSSL
ncbi:MAG TPA: 2-phosphosulfolactate phosphatase [Candidatus Methylacidiphilales bacterium]|nr:2-phosphosulfolactate phosphatase [Candidatus Methylacidiphilales bacterium]